MRARLREVFGSRQVHRTTILGMVAAVCALAPLGPLTGTASATTGHIDEFRPAGLLESPVSDPLGLTVGPDGNIWFTNADPTAIKTIGRFHVATTSFDPNADYFSNGDRGSDPVAIARSSDGNLWFANFGNQANDLGVVTAQGATPKGIKSPIVISHALYPTSTLTDITPGPPGDQHMWFTMFGNGNIGRVGLNGAFDPTKDVFTLPGGTGAGATNTATDQPEAIVAGPNGHLWFTVDDSKVVEEMDTSGHMVQRISIPAPNNKLLAGITVGPDASTLWVTAEGDSTPSGTPDRPNMVGNGALLSVTPGGTVTAFHPPAGSAPKFSPNAIVAGPDGNIWFNDVGDNLIWRFNPSTQAFNSFNVPTASAFSGNVQPTGMIVGPDNNIWFTENDEVGALARVTVDPNIQLAPSPADFGSVLPNSTANLNVVASNVSAVTYTITSAASISGANASDFTFASNGCAAGAFNASATCTMAIQFKPSDTGTRTATLTLPVNDGAANATINHTTVLTGIGQSSTATFGPGAADFGNAEIGTVSPPVAFSLSNVTGQPVTVNSVAFGDPNPTDFRALQDTCTGRTIPTNSSCTIGVAFAPTTVGARSSSLTVTANGTALPSASLTGNGVPAPPGNGYWLDATDGGIFAFGSAKFFGSTGSIKLNKPMVGMAPTTSGQGYWLVASDGGIFAFGDAKFFGSTGSIKLNQPIVGMAPTPTGGGYWLVATDGGIFAFGDAKFFGSTGSIKLNKPIVGMAASPDGQGYWLVAADGGIFSFGDAKFFGSTGSIKLNKPIVGMASAPDGQGYWFVATDGGIFAFGSATFHGSTGSIKLNQPIAGMAATQSGQGYWLVATDGGIFSFGDAKFFGSTGSIKLNKPIVGMASAA